MNNKNIDKWIYGIRNIMVENGINDSSITDEQILGIIAGLFLPNFEDHPVTQGILLDVPENIIATAYLKAMLSIAKPEGKMFEGLDIELLRAKLNQN